jgi:hypothetical protein
MQALQVLASAHAAVFYASAGLLLHSWVIGILKEKKGGKLDKASMDPVGVARQECVTL